eukprot:3643817-Amphidinium_carterae.1
MEEKPRAACDWVPPKCSSETQEISSSSELGRSSCKHSVDKELVSSSTFKVPTCVLPRLSPLVLAPEDCPSDSDPKAMLRRQG